MKSGWNDERECPECGEPVRVAFYPGSPGKTYGRPEDCYPPEGADLDYEDPECKACRYEFTPKDVYRWIEEIEEEQKSYAEHWDEGPRGRDDND